MLTGPDSFTLGNDDRAARGAFLPSDQFPNGFVTGGWWVLLNIIASFRWALWRRCDYYVFSAVLSERFLLGSCSTTLIALINMMSLYQIMYSGFLCWKWSSSGRRCCIVLRSAPKQRRCWLLSDLDDGFYFMYAMPRHGVLMGYLVHFLVSYIKLMNVLKQMKSENGSLCYVWNDWIWLFKHGAAETAIFLSGNGVRGCFLFILISHVIVNQLLATWSVPPNQIIFLLFSNRPSLVGPFKSL